MGHRLLIVTGKDRPGIVSAVSGFLAGARMNLEDLRMSILEGQFAMMLIVKIPPKAARVLEAGLAQLEKKWRLAIFQCPLRLPAGRGAGAGAGGTQPFLVRVIGRDKTGIVAGVSRELARRGCNITDLQCRILGSGARTIYTMILEGAAPAGVAFGGLQKSFKRLERRLGVEIHVGAADVFNL